MSAIGLIGGIFIALEFAGLHKPAPFPVFFAWIVVLVDCIAHVGI